MPLFDRSTVSAGLSKPPNMSGVLGKQTLPYNGSYVMLDPRGRDGEGFAPHWSNSKAVLAEGTSRVCHFPGAAGPNHVKQNIALYTNPSDVNSPTASADGRRQKAECEDLSPSPENSVYFALPKSVYRAGHCGNGQGCVMGPPYSMEYCSRRPNSLYEREWMQREAPYSKMTPIQQKRPDPLLQQRGVPFEPTVDSLNRINVDPFTSHRARTLPVILEPNFNRYHCAPTLNAPLSDPRHPLQSAARGYPGLYSPSHRTYEHMISDAFQEPSSMTKYGQRAHYPVFYCPQSNVDAEQRMQCKETTSKLGEDVPVIHKHSVPNSREHCIVTQSLHSDIPLPFPGTEMLPVHPFMQGFSYPCYAVPRFHSDANHIRAPLKSQHTLPVFNYSLLNVSPSRQHKDHPRTSPTSPSKDVDQVSAPSPFMCMNQTSPTRLLRQEGTSPYSMQMAKLFPAFSGRLVNPAVLSPMGMNMNRLTDFLPSQGPEIFQKRTQSLPPPMPTWLSHTDQFIAAPDGPKIHKAIYSPVPVVKTESKKNGSGSPGPKDYLKRKHSNSSPPIKIKEESLYEEVIRKKQKKINHQLTGNPMNSPQMPVIDNVFSLAHYRANPNVFPVSPGVEAPLIRTQSSDQCEGKQEMNRKNLDSYEQRPECGLIAIEIFPCATKESAVAESLEPPKVKVENVDSSERALVEHPDCIKVIIKRELEDYADPPSSNLSHECESEEVRSEPPSEIEKAVSDPPTSERHRESPPQGDVLHPHNLAVPSPAEADHPPPQPESLQSLHKVHFKCLPIPPNQNIQPEVRHPSPIPTDRPPAPLVTARVPKPVPHIPVRKHFFELHHSFCKLVSESVSASSEQELKSWLSQQEIGPVSPSNKVQKVTCLLGVKAREVWIKEEMKLALKNILLRLREYICMDCCPFPHIMRMGAVFLPMLVVKELLFPTVQGSLVDKVLQEHKVELRPTTLSEEKILIQLHKRACSSKLRRLMSLKHLPDIYADVVNILYYTSVCKRLGVDYGDQDEDDVSENWMSTVFSDVPSAASPSDLQPPLSNVEDQEAKPVVNGSRTKSRVKRSSRRLFLDCSVSDEENKAGDAEKGNDHRKSDDIAQQETLLVLQNNSWMCPLSDSDGEMAEPSSKRPRAKVRTKDSSGMILRLRKMHGGLKKKSDCYQSVPLSGTFSNSSLYQTHDDEKQTKSKQKTPTVTQSRQRVGKFSHALRSLGSSSKRKRTPLLKIKYCPDLSACHSAEHRRRWVLRSAVRKAHMAMMRVHYPDLIGKRIRHLYEEDDKSEVWYRGEVLRVHEANTNPLKTIFEVRYDSEPEWKYYLELLMDYKKGWLKVED